MSEEPSEEISTGPPAKKPRLDGDEEKDEGDDDDEDDEEDEGEAKEHGESKGDAEKTDKWVPV